MFTRLVLGAVTAGALAVLALAGMRNGDEAGRFVTGKVFAFSCFDGSRGAGRVLDDLGAAGSIQFSGSGPIRHVRLPGNTLQIRGQAVCASIKGLPFEPCFNLDKRVDRSLRGATALAASPRGAVARGGRRTCRGNGARRNAAGRERQARAGEIRAEVGA